MQHLSAQTQFPVSCFPR